MKKSLIPIVLSLFVLHACKQDPGNSVAPLSLKPVLSLEKSANPEWTYRNLRLYPVRASAELTAQNSGLEHFKTLAEAMQTPGFRILECKSFGRNPDNWYNALTVQNKTQDTVLLISGDVVKGGNQDRVLAHHEVIMPMSVRNIEVFCVEAGRSSYYNQDAAAAEKQVAAFSGYFSVASPSVRKAVEKGNDQQAVWNAVAEVTKANGAESNTHAYTALDHESEQKARRDDYLRHLEKQFEQQQDIVGVVAVCGDKVLGVDIFGNAGLFRSKYPALLHGYVAEAATMDENLPTVSEGRVAEAFGEVSALASARNKSTDAAGKFVWGNSWVHLFRK